MPPQTTYAEPLQPAAYQQPAPYTHQPNPYSQQLAYQPMMPAAYPQMPFNQEAQPRPYNQTTPTQMSHTPLPPRQLFAAQPQQTSDLYSLVEVVIKYTLQIHSWQKMQLILYIPINNYNTTWDLPRLKPKVNIETIIKFVCLYETLENFKLH